MCVNFFKCRVFQIILAAFVQYGTVKKNVVKRLKMGDVDTATV